MPTEAANEAEERANLIRGIEADLVAATAAREALEDAGKDTDQDREAAVAAARELEAEVRRIDQLLKGS